MSKHTQHSHIQFVGNLLLVLGATVLGSNFMQALPAMVTGKGSLVGTVEPPVGLMLTEAPVLMSAAPQPERIGATIAFGMLMMLIGFGLHAWIVLRKNDEQTVPVKKAPRTSRRQAEVIWVERTIRF